MVHGNVGKTEKTLIALIDGECVMCSAISQWIIARDAAGAFRFASLQSPVGRRLMREGGMSENALNTFVLIDNGRYYTKSTAALKVLRKLGGKWRLLYSLIIIPKPLRNLGYDFIAKRRYRWFGKTDSCPLPTAQLRSRFIDQDTGADGSKS
ncbi:thiol-disulfide oxidoreductase DCC family protein [Cohnella yongneupensis]|uniref:Thiol-disulfide oxidoreductase DCC family protein n=1 Tax=Cohnella yongneupensis TaxID=425006 RepID=A0ABW0R6H4_9BACL